MHYSHPGGGYCRTDCDGYCPDTLRGGIGLAVTFLAFRELAGETQSRINSSISPYGNGVHKKHALNLPAMIGINKSVMASGFKERVPRGVHPDE